MGLWCAVLQPEVLEDFLYLLFVSAKNLLLTSFLGEYYLDALSTDGKHPPIVNHLCALFCIVSVKKQSFSRWFSCLFSTFHQFGNLSPIPACHNQRLSYVIKGFNVFCDVAYF